MVKLSPKIRQKVQPLLVQGITKLTISVEGVEEKHSTISTKDAVLAVSLIQRQEDV